MKFLPGGIRDGLLHADNAMRLHRVPGNEIAHPLHDPVQSPNIRHPAPDVNGLSSSRPFLLKMPARWPSSATPVSPQVRAAESRRRSFLGRPADIKHESSGGKNRAEASQGSLSGRGRATPTVRARYIGAGIWIISLISAGVSGRAVNLFLSASDSTRSRPRTSSGHSVALGKY